VIIPSADGVASASAIVVCVLLAGLTALQVALLAGAPLGRFAWGGQDRVLPRGKRVGSAVSIALYGVFAVLVLRRAGLVAVLPEGLAVVGCWVLAGYFLLGVLMNAASRSKPERWTMAPLCLVLAGLTLLVAAG
jgi:hypothetical protein